ncbi:MAG: ORF6N domain protein [bacterium ADurb.Bin157]|nr:MAG: ORF6N domain protein [bacterium ADurb.Bin157]
MRRRGKTGRITGLADATPAPVSFFRSRLSLLDFELAQLYAVKTKALKQAVKRNIRRFPSDFMFELTKDEWLELVTNCDHIPASLKHSYIIPMAFTEQGVAMLSSVLRSEVAIDVNIQIMRAFVKLRKFAASHEELAKKLKDLEKAVKGHGGDIKLIFATINTMLNPKAKKKPQIGFKP